VALLLLLLLLLPLLQVLHRANDNAYGLAAGVFSRNVDDINTLTRGIRSGTVWVNCYNLYDVSTAVDREL
jgi:acyl-CoA reductase-like NAD-dependent aldehyde dehydrogenase